MKGVLFRWWGWALRVRCLFGHDWEMQQCLQHCRRCGALGGEIHQWTGCICKVCEKFRDEQHERVDCHCRRCRKPMHDWKDGVCTRCRRRCEHAEVSFVWKRVESGDTARVVKVKCCEVCQHEVDVIYESTPRKLRPERSSSDGFLATPTRADMAADPLWQELRECWLILSGPRYFQTENAREFRRWYDGYKQPGGPQPRLHYVHQEALKALVNLGQLSKAAADEIQRGFDETTYHISRSMATCYLRSPPERQWRDNLFDQLRALNEMAERGVLDRSIARSARRDIARDLDRLPSNSDAPWLPGVPFISVSASSTAAQIIVDLLAPPTSA